jgi:large subunit ribosomal protein L29
MTTKVSEELKQARELDEQGLEEKIAARKNELMTLRFRKASGQLDHTAQLKIIRRDIARLMTVKSEKRQAAAASATAASVS